MTVACAWAVSESPATRAHALLTSPGKTQTFVLSPATPLSLACLPTSAGATATRSSAASRSSRRTPPSTRWRRLLGFGPNTSPDQSVFEPMALVSIGFDGAERRKRRGTHMCGVFCVGKQVARVPPPAALAMPPPPRTNAFKGCFAPWPGCHFRSVRAVRVVCSTQECGRSCRVLGPATSSHASPCACRTRALLSSRTHQFCSQRHLNPLTCTCLFVFFSGTRALVLEHRQAVNGGYNVVARASVSADGFAGIVGDCWCSCLCGSSCVVDAFVILVQLLFAVFGTFPARPPRAHHAAAFDCVCAPHGGRAHTRCCSTASPNANSRLGAALTLPTWPLPSVPTTAQRPT